MLKFKRTILIPALLLLGALCINCFFVFSNTSSRIWWNQQYEKFQNQNERGFVNRYYFDKAGKKHKYVVFVPYHLKPNDKPPLMLHLHGAGKRGTDGVSHLRDGMATKIWSEKRHFPFVVLFPQEPTDRWWQNDSELVDDLISLLDSTIKEYHIDPDRVSITGLSSGATAAWNVVNQYPDRFSAIVPLSSLCDLKLIKSATRSNISIWDYYVHGDKPESGDCHRAVFQDLLEMGLSPHYSELNGFAAKGWNLHNSWGFFTSNQGCLKWLMDQNRKENQTQRRPFRLIFREQDFPKWQPITDNWSYNDHGILSHTGSQKNKTSPAIYQNKHKNYDLHFEFKVEKGTGCQLLFFSGNGSNYSRYWAANFVPPEEGSCGIVVHPEKKWLQSCDLLAQQAFHSGEWNDLRIRVLEDQLSVHLNGWELFSLKDDRVLNLNGQFALESLPEEASLTKWRYLRMREID